MALANPDLVARVRAGLPLNISDAATFYGGNEAGYTDHPTMAGQQGDSACSSASVTVHDQDPRRKPSRSRGLVSTTFAAPFAAQRLGGFDVHDLDLVQQCSGGR